MNDLQAQLEAMLLRVLGAEYTSEQRAAAARVEPTIGGVLEFEANPDLEVDPSRVDRDGATGIYVRCYGPTGWGDWDIATLTRDSLIQCLQSRGGMNEQAEEVVARLLGHP